MTADCRSLERLAVGSVLLLLLATTVLSGGAAAQQATPEPGNATDACPEPEAIDRNVELCSADLDGGVAVLTFRADRTEVITLADAGADSGIIPTRDVALQADGTTTVRFPVTKTDSGESGVTIDTARVLYLKKLSEPNVLIGGPWTITDARVAGLGSAAGTLFGALVTVLRRREAISGLDPRRVA